MLLVVAGYVLAQHLTTGPRPARCTVRAADGTDSADYHLKPEQAANGATVAAVAARRGLPERAVDIALATAMQESGLRNLHHGDKDSLGVFQQRPSQGWGPARKILDPVYSANRFYDHLLQIDYARLPLTVAAQHVQRSRYPQAYAKHEKNAVRLTAALTGRRAASFSCTQGPNETHAEAGSEKRIREVLAREFGKDALPGRHGTAADTSTTSTASKAAEAGGSAADGKHAKAGAGGGELHIPAPTRQRGWELAHWAVARAADLHISQVVYRGRVWDADSLRGGWRMRGSTDGGAPGDTSTVTVLPATGR